MMMSSQLAMDRLQSERQAHCSQTVEDTQPKLRNTNIQNQKKMQYFVYRNCCLKNNGT